MVAIASMPQSQMEKFYGSPETAQMYLYIGICVPRVQHPRPRDVHARPPRDGRTATRTTTSLTDGERICSTAIGWNFGDGHMHNEQLIAALQERCHFEPGEVRVVLLDAQPIHRQRQEYRLVDAATGEFERGYRAGRRHGDAPAVGRHRARARDVVEGRGTRALR